MVAETFYNKTRAGTIGERVFYRWLTEERGVPTGNIKDVRKDPFWQALDIDFLVRTKDNKLLKVEVKTSQTAHETGYLVWDYTKNSGAVGKLERSQADVVFWYLPATDQKYYMKLPETRKHVHNSHTLELKQMYDSQVYKLPIKTLLAEGLMREI